MAQKTLVARSLTVAKRVPVTLTLAGILLLVGLFSGGLWRSFADSDLFSSVAYGLPALSAGRWWTPITGTLTFTSVAMSTVTSLPDPRKVTT